MSRSWTVGWIAVAFVLRTSDASAWDAMAGPCLSSKLRPDLIGHWRYVGRPPGSCDAELSDRMRPHPDSLELGGDGSWVVEFSGAQLEHRREQGMGDAATLTGTWTVGKYCAGDIFLPHEWLRFYPGPRSRHFELEGDRLTIFYPFGSGCGHELYERVPESR